jgi:hypothetical protein
MPSQQLVILHEGQPSRCEICHQSDCFDRVKGECSRCRKISARLKRQKPPRQASHPDDASALQVFGALLLFAAHLYFLPNARALIQNRTMALVVYSLFVLIGSLLLFCGKHYSKIIDFLLRLVRINRLRS